MPTRVSAQKQIATIIPKQDLNLGETDWEVGLLRLVGAKAVRAIVLNGSFKIHQKFIQLNVASA